MVKFQKKLRRENRKKDWTRNEKKEKKKQIKLSQTKEEGKTSGSLKGGKVISKRENLVARFAREMPGVEGVPE